MCCSRSSYRAPETVEHKSYRPQTRPDPARIDEALALIAKAERPLIYGGGGIIIRVRKPARASPSSCGWSMPLAR